jgi:hypothetical protein
LASAIWTELAPYEADARIYLTYIELQRCLFRYRSDEAAFIADLSGA